MLRSDDVEALAPRGRNFFMATRPQERCSYLYSGISRSTNVQFVAYSLLAEGRVCRAASVDSGTPRAAVYGWQITSCSAMEAATRQSTHEVIRPRTARSVGHVRRSGSTW